MSFIEIKDKRFTTYIPESEIQEAVRRIARQMNDDLQGLNPLFICVLNGAFMFTADLLGRFDDPCEVSFIRLQSYEGTVSSGQVKEVHGLIDEIENRHIIILEDIIDTGRTIAYLKERLIQHRPASVKIATLLLKREALVVPVEPDYVAFEIDNDFVVGYGLDYDQQGRNLRDIYIVTE